MLLSKTVMVRWNGFTRKYYEEHGYIWTKQNDYFECKIEDLQVTSPIKVWVQCDYCDEKFEKNYRDRFKVKDLLHKDCCSKRECMVNKSKEISLLKYGVTSYTKTNESKQRLREIFQTPKDEIFKVANEKGIEILNVEDYENDRTRLFVICKTHNDKGIQETNFANIKKNKHCCIYIKNQPSKRKLDGSIIVKEFIDYGLIPNFVPEDYISNSQPLPYVCPKHLDKGIQYRQYSNLKHCNGCEYCSRERTGNILRNNQDEVFEYFTSKGLIVLDNQKYLNKEQQIFFRCQHHYEQIQSSSYGNLKNINIPCEYCRNEMSLSSLNRRLRSSINEWRENAINECESKCILTGDQTFEVHHLYSFNTIIKDALNELNILVKSEYSGEEIILIKDKVIELHGNVSGVCLRPDLHILFHQIYGKYENTSEQFNEFKQNYINNKFKEAI